MKKVLMISLAFPPLPVVGSYRIAKFCKYLPQLGWQPFVLTEKIRDVANQKDWEALKDIGDNTRIIRTMNIQPFYWFDNRSKHTGTPEYSEPKSSQGQSDYAGIYQRDNLSKATSVPFRNAISLIRKIMTVPDARLAWIPQAILPGLTCIYKEKIDLIFSSSPPPTNHILGHFLSVLSNRPQIVEYRDLWTLAGGYFMKAHPRLLQKYDSFWERRIVRHCKGIVVVTGTFKKKLEDGFAGAREKNIAIIYNGVDEEDYKHLDVTHNPKEHFSIDYFGNLYGFRNPAIFYEALSKWMEIDPEVQAKVRVNFWGDIAPDFYPQNFADKLKHILVFHSRLPRNEVIPKMFQSDILVLIQGTDYRIADSIPAKLFEYIASGRPILAFLPECEAAEIVKSSDKNMVASSPEIDEIITYLQNHFALWQNGQEPDDVKPIFKPDFSRLNQTRQLSEYFNNIIHDV